MFRFLLALILAFAIANPVCFCSTPSDVTEQHVAVCPNCPDSSQDGEMPLACCCKGVALAEADVSRAPEPAPENLLLVGFIDALGILSEEPISPDGFLVDSEPVSRRSLCVPSRTGVFLI